MANPVIKGLHHITLCASGAQEDVDFCTQVLGQRLIKQTVLFDGRYAHYHLYYANANAEVGSVLTTFPYKRVPGRPGSGQISSTAYTTPKGAVKFWKDHLDRHKVEHSGILERFGQAFIRFKHPSGLLMEVIEDPADKRQGWTTDQKNLYEELGYTDCSEIKDRNYFHSIYVRSPAGILTECAATAEGGFLRDESYEDLGTTLLLPPWFEHERAKIVAMLEPIVVPEANRPKGAKPGAAKPVSAPPPV